MGLYGTEPKVTNFKFSSPIVARLNIFCLSLHRLILILYIMVQNVFTFTHRFVCKAEGELHDFSSTISKLANEGWIVKQISSTTYSHGSSSFIAVTVLAEKSE